jgi:hypothetical protein
MVLDYLNGTGECDEDMGTGPLYSLRDLEKGVIYAEGWLADGIKVEPFYRFRMDDFATWCREKIKAYNKKLCGRSSA